MQTEMRDQKEKKSKEPKEGKKKKQRAGSSSENKWEGEDISEAQDGR